MSPLLLYVVKSDEHFLPGLIMLLIFDSIFIFILCCDWCEEMFLEHYIGNRSQPVRQWRKRGWNWDATLRCLYSICIRSVFLSVLRWFLCYFSSSASLSSDCRKHVNQALCICLNHSCAMWRADFKDAAGIITPIFHFEYFMASYFINKRCSHGWYLLKTDNLAF